MRANQFNSVGLVEYLWQRLTVWNKRNYCNVVTLIDEEPREALQIVIRATFAGILGEDGDSKMCTIEVVGTLVSFGHSLNLVRQQRIW